MFRRNRLPSITAAELKKKIAENKQHTLLDVRTNEEWKDTGIIPGSVMIEMQDLPKLLDDGLSFEGKEPVIVICRSGVRSAEVTNYLVNRFGLNAMNLTGGVIAWYQLGEEFEQI